MYEEAVSSRGKKMPRSTWMVIILGSFALLLCTASALVGGVFVGIIVSQRGGESYSGDSMPAPHRIDPTVVPPDMSVMPTIPPPFPTLGSTPTPVPASGEIGGATATPLPFSGESGGATAAPAP
jgi:hypothetical protein